MKREQRLDSVDMPNPFLSQSVEFAVWPPRVLFFDCWNAHEVACLPIAAPPGLQSPQKALSIDAVRLYPPGAAVDFEARRVHDPACDPRPFQAALQPEPIVAGLKYAFDIDGPKRSSRRGAARLLTGSDQSGCIAAVNAASRDLVGYRIMDREHPGRFAQIDSDK